MLMTSLEIAEALSEDVELYSSPAMLDGSVVVDGLVVLYQLRFLI